MYWEFLLVRLGGWEWYWEKIENYQSRLNSILLRERGIFFEIEETLLRLRNTVTYPRSHRQY